MWNFGFEVYDKWEHSEKQGINGKGVDFRLILYRSLFGLTLTLKVEAVYSSETLVSFCWIMHRYLSVENVLWSDMSSYSVQNIFENLYSNLIRTYSVYISSAFHAILPS
jgi:hypothetical protein